MANLHLASSIFSSSIKEMFIWEFHICAHICALVLAQSLIQTGIIVQIIFFIESFNLFFPFSPSIKFVQSVCQEHQMTGGAECFVAGGTQCFVTGVAECSVPEGTECFVPQGAECFVPRSTEHFVVTSLVVLSTCHHPNASSCSSSFLQMGQCSPNEHFSATCLGINIAWGITVTWVGVSVLTVGAGVGVVVGWIGQSFLVSNKFLKGWPCARPRGALSDRGIGYMFQWWRVGAFILGSGCWIWDFSEFSCCQFVYHYQYRLCRRPYYWCLGADSGYHGGRCSWSWDGRYRLGE